MKNNESQKAGLLSEIQSRWSPRSFDLNRPVSKEKILHILNAARWAPSSFNEQPWRYIIGIYNNNTYQKIFQTLVSFNQSWCKNVPILILAIHKNISSKTEKPNNWAGYDLGQSVAFLTLEAVKEGLHLHQMGGFSQEKAIELLKIPREYTPKTVIAMGYKDTPDKLPEDLKKQEIQRSRRQPLEEMVFFEHFGDSA